MSEVVAVIGRFIPGTAVLTGPTQFQPFVLSLDTSCHVRSWLIPEAVPTASDGGLVI
jgi:hypothetical protein